MTAIGLAVVVVQALGVLVFAALEWKDAGVPRSLVI
jgi:hypothetical protein